MIERTKIIISGQVTGVFFRKFIHDHALQLGIKGHVRNTPNGKVEAVLEGSSEAIAKLIQLCKTGPPGAKVENIKIKKEKVKNLKDFTILR